MAKIEDKRDFYINGQWVAPIAAKDLQVENPATEETIAFISIGSPEDLERAVSSAKAAFPSYATSSLDERIALLEAMKAVYTRRYDEMAAVITSELGAPTDMSVDAQAHVGIGHLQGFIDAIKRFSFERKLANGDIVLREPMGICGLITPWNWPVNQMALKVVPALAMGNCCILKPSELTPLSAMLYAEIVDEAGFPAGTFNLVNGDGAGVGRAMTSHPDIDMISFTGSTRAGTDIAKTSADTVKKVTLELGGKSPNIVFADAAIEAAVVNGVKECMYNSGQSCDAPTRMLVERSVYDQALDIAQRAAAEIKCGDPTQPGDHIGPLVSAQQLSRVHNLIQTGITEGARLLTGGTNRPAGVSSGHYCSPTVFGDVNNDMTIARTEVFGPVLSIIPFEDEADAIRIANDTPYGLAAYINTTNNECATRVARQLRAGMIHVNGAGHNYGSPFGGYKMSGVGREGGALGLEDFTEVKSLHLP